MTPTHVPAVSLIIATCGRPEILRKTLDSLLRQSLPRDSWELLLVDNRPASPDTQEVARHYLDSLPLVILEEPRPGKNFALNTALPKARGELLVFSDDDVLAAPDWLAALTEAAHGFPDFDIFGGTIVPHWPDGARAPNYDTKNPLIAVAYVIADRGGELRPLSGYDVWGPNMLVRRSLFDAGHRFNTSVGPDGSKSYIMGSETDFTTRMEALGSKCLYVPKALVRHQIRRNQLSDRWLHERTMRLGRAESRRWPFPEARRFLGIPLFCYRGIATGIIRWLRGAITRNPAHRADGLSLWLWLGRASQYRMDADSN